MNIFGNYNFMIIIYRFTLFQLILLLLSYVHRKEKNFACGQCEYKTLFKSDLIKHQNAVHHGIRKICPHCGKHASNLSEHIRFVHARTKNYKCNVCAYACVKPADLRKHISAVHKGSLIT